MLFFIVFTFILQTGNIEASCFPESSLRYPYNNKSIQLSEFEVRNQIERFQIALEPVVSGELNKKLIVELDWDNDRVNALATRDDNNNPVIQILGGMARHPEMTRDALLLVLCHELGHHLGGAPRQFRGQSALRSWSSAEGQADYYAAAKCLRRIFEDGKETFIPSPSEELEAAKRCHGDDFCVRTSLAAKTLTQIFASMRDGLLLPELSRFDSSLVKATNYSHPSPQCRLDTFVAGARCEQMSEEGFDAVDARVGACHTAENERPSCWFGGESLFK
jgi:hypothetical protein